MVLYFVATALLTVPDFCCTVLLTVPVVPMVLDRMCCHFLNGAGYSAGSKKERIFYAETKCISEAKDA